MKKSHIFIISVFGINIIIGGYSIFSGAFKNNRENTKANIVAYRNTKYFIEKLGGDYDVISGREGGWFTFKATFKNDVLNSNRDDLSIRNIFFKKISKNIYAICWDNGGAKVFKDIKNTFIFEYKGHLAECENSAYPIAKYNPRIIKQ